MSTTTKEPAPADGKQTDAVVAVEEEGRVSRAAKTVLKPTVDHLEAYTVKGLHLVETKTVQVLDFSSRKTNEWATTAFGADDAERLKVLGQDGIHIGTNAFHNVGGIADQFAALVEETAFGLLEVAEQASEIVTEGPPDSVGQKVKKKCIEAYETIRDTSEIVSEKAGKGAEEYFSGTRTEAERWQLLKNGAEGAKGHFGMLLTVLAARDGASSAPNAVPRVIDVVAAKLPDFAGEKDLFHKPCDEAMRDAVALHVDRFDSDPGYMMGDEKDPHVFAAVLVEFFRQLPQPLFMTKNYVAITGATQSDNALEIIAPLIAELPGPHKVLIFHMIDWTSKMGKQHEDNIAQTFAPVWLRRAGDGPDQTPLAVDAVKLILKYPGKLKKLIEQYDSKAGERADLRRAVRLTRDGATQFVQGNYEAAMTHWEEALAIREKLYGPGHPSTAPIYGNMAVCLSMQGETTKAMEYNSKCTQLLR
mmetsp:Transcript_29327/g.68004  ORF Transcript_29327/g.68004 Transcript_29327/m.68004 type:complete len:475 (+) Transcript_29327:26-1450(+)|eukprot:CAMPEP_0114558690 /NCGR_PEP_ID=MMETSP0114-20121206/10521_1 /TAXON_ID=31324 /ORGANISM="Goniomonas sp, Strain m" /LENGTH=474 /DNA_ID=CAMNT_0001744107 /DNA_START=25 /DNA_END=1449 /DNA_ORIENTATION=+